MNKFVNLNSILEILDETFEAFPECDLFYLVLRNKIEEIENFVVFHGVNKYEED